MLSKLTIPISKLTGLSGTQWAINCSFYETKWDWILGCFGTTFASHPGQTRIYEPEWIWNQKQSLTDYFLHGEDVRKQKRYEIMWKVKFAHFLLCEGILCFPVKIRQEDQYHSFVEWISGSGRRLVSLASWTLEINLLAVACLLSI